MLSKLDPAVIYVAIVMAVLILVTLIVTLNRYKRTGPNRAMIISGAPFGAGRRDRVVINGGSLVWPFIQEVTYISLAVESLELNIPDVFTKDDERQTLSAVAQVKVKSDPESIARYAELFLNNEEEKKRAIERIVKNHILAQFRTRILQDIFLERGEIAIQVWEQAADDLDRLGLDMISLDLTDISDRNRPLKLGSSADLS